MQTQQSVRSQEPCQSSGALSDRQVHTQPPHRSTVSQVQDAEPRPAVKLNTSIEKQAVLNII